MIVKLTGDELSRLDYIFPEMPRDRRPRVYVCDCADAYAHAKGKRPPNQERKTGKENAFAEAPVTPLADGSCPHCGYITKLVVA